MKKGKKALHDSMIRSAAKKRNLPTPIMRDPFIGLMYINKNGRAVKVKGGAR